MFLLFGILILVVGGLMMWVAGLSWDPFFLPLDIFLLVALLFLMVLTGLNFFFRNLEIRHNVRDSQKYLMTRNSQRSGLAIIIICIFVGVIVILPFVAESANQILSTEARDAVSGLGDRYVKNFDNQDRLGLFKSEWVDFELNTGGVGLQLCDKADYQIDDICDDPLVDRSVIQGENVRIQVPEEGYEQLALIITNGALGPSSFGYHIERNPAPVFINIQPLLICIVFIVMNSIWFVYLQPIRRRYATSSVYSEDYVAALGVLPKPTARRTASSLRRSSTFRSTTTPRPMLPRTRPSPPSP